MNNRSMGLDLTEGSVSKKLLQYAFPLMLSTALQQVYSLVDMIIVGQVLGSVGLASVSVGSQMAHFVMMVSIGFTNACSVLISQAYGAKNRSAMKELIGTAFTVTGMAAVFFTIVAIVFRRGFLGIINTPTEAFYGAERYLFYSSLGFIFIFGYNIATAIFKGMGDSKRPLVFIAISSAVNLVLDLVFVAGLHWGAAGAALATSISQAVSCVVAIMYLYKKRDELGFDFRLQSFHIVKARLIPLLRLGIPMSITMAAIQFSFIVISANINKYGVDPAAAFAVGQRIDGLCGIVCNATSAAVGVMVGQNFGAGKLDRIEKTTRVALGINVAVYFVFGLLFQLFPSQVFRIFTKDLATLALARTVMTGLVCAYPFNALMHSYRGVVQGVGFAGLEMGMGLFDGVILRIFLAYFFGSFLHLGFFGFVLGYSTAAAGTGIPSLIYYLSRKWKKRKALVEKA